MLDSDVVEDDACHWVARVAQNHARRQEWRIDHDVAQRDISEVDASLCGTMRVDWIVESTLVAQLLLRLMLLLGADPNCPPAWLGD